MKLEISVCMKVSKHCSPANSPLHCDIEHGYQDYKQFRCAFKMLTGKPKGKRPLERPRHRCEDNIRMDLEEIGINAGNWVDSTQDRDYWRALVNAA